ncbi:MAG TPA: dihydroorotate dehydrogenase, partial [Clostridiaceae bacterium]|nr:dihydroorotate dehydrogenase [Clostridiaceae bacterium]
RLGGIMDTEDVLAFLMVGATAVQLGTGHFVNPRLGQEVIEGLLAYCEQEGLHQIEEIRGIV